MRLKVLVFVFLLSCASAPTQKSVLDEILQRNVLKVGTTFDYAPFTHRDYKGNPIGTDLEQAKSLAKSLGVKLELVKTTWANLLTDLQAKKFDIAMGGISKKLSRQKVGFFSTPYMNNGKLPITHCKNKNNYNSVKKINRPSTRVVVNPGGTNYDYAFDNLSKAKITVHPDNNTIFLEIVAGRADIMFTDYAEVYYQIKKHPGVLCAAMDKPVTKGVLAYLMPRDIIWKEYVDAWLASQK